MTKSLKFRSGGQIIKTAEINKIHDQKLPQLWWLSLIKILSLGSFDYKIIKFKIFKNEEKSTNLFLEGYQNAKGIWQNSYHWQSSIWLKSHYRS